MRAAGGIARRLCGFGRVGALIANTSPFEGQGRVTLFFEDGGTSTREIALPPSSRTSVSMGSGFPGARDRRFGVRVESVGDVPAQLVVESAEYGDSDGVVWASGTAVLAKRLP